MQILCLLQKKKTLATLKYEQHISFDDHHQQNSIIAIKHLDIVFYKTHCRCSYYKFICNVQPQIFQRLFGIQYVQQFLLSVCMVFLVCFFSLHLLLLLYIYFLPVLLLFRNEDAILIRGRVYMWLPCWSNYVQLLQLDQMRTNYSAQIQVIKYLAFN